MLTLYHLTVDKLGCLLFFVAFYVNLSLIIF